ADDLVDLLRRVAEPGQGRWDGGVNDLEVTAAGQLFELDEREVRLDTGGIAIHYQADSPRGGDYRDLSIAVAVLFAQLEHAVAFTLRRFEKVGRAGPFIDTHRGYRQRFVLLFGSVVGSPSMVANHPEHGVAIGLVTRKWPDLGGDLGRGGVGRCMQE